jgi:hypothetical protein
MDLRIKTHIKNCITVHKYDFQKTTSGQLQMMANQRKITRYQRDYNGYILSV